MRPFVNISLVLGAVLGAIYIIRDYIRDRTNTKVRLLKEDLEEETLSENEDVYLRPH
jgi:TRAP-type C4-dicarboxylate transport system permease small subunit